MYSLTDTNVLVMNRDPPVSSSSLSLIVAGMMLEDSGSIPQAKDGIAIAFGIVADDRPANGWIRRRCICLRC